MRFRIEDREYEVSEDDITIGEACEAEAALGLDAAGGSMAVTATALFVAMRRAEPHKPAKLIAADVRNVKLTDLGEEEDSPPAQGAEAPESQLEKASAADAEKSGNAGGGGTEATSSSASPVSSDASPEQGGEGHEDPATTGRLRSVSSA